MNKDKGIIENIIKFFSLSMYKLRNIKVDISQLSSQNAREILKENIKFKDLHIGERCFILGNGPSLNNCDLKRLNDQHTFCVNNMIRIKGIADVRPEYYVLADPIWFKKKMEIEEDKKFIDGISELSTLNSLCTLFVPYNEISKIRYYGWDSRLKINYFYTGKNFEASSSIKHDITKAIPSVNSVIMYSVLIALYMGFKKIYLIGCEETGIFGILHSYMDEKQGSEYAFSMTDEERKKITEYSQSVAMNVSDFLRDTARIFDMYEMLYSYCISCGCEVFTCSDETLIRSIPFADYNELFSG